ncbi:MAG: ChaN family lipoprotein [Terriglobales bacterium]
MANPSHLRSRRSAAQLHALEGVEREIRANDHNGRRKYLKDFSTAFRTYETVLDAARVQDAVRSVDLVLIGDYHALPACQRFASSLLEQLAIVGDRPVVLGVETIFARDQHILDEWWRREIDENELRERMRFQMDWGYDWAPFYELLVTAREHSDAIYGLDCMPREDLRKIGARDRHAAEKIGEIRQRHPGAVILVLFGESHLAPAHLPREVRAVLPQERVLTVLQNVDALYWRAAGERHERVEAVRVAQDVVCVFNATPLEKYENYRLCLDRWKREESDQPDLGPTVYNLIDGLVRFLGINRYSPHNTTQPKFLVDLLPEVYYRSSDGLLRRLLSRKGVSEEEREAMLQRVEDRGCAYLPQVNAFYMHDFQMVHASEEATRFLHHACRGLPVRVTAREEAADEPADFFYARVLENTLAYFGSRVLYPARAAVRETDLRDLSEQTREDVERQTGLGFAESMRALDFLLLHRLLEVDVKQCERVRGSLDEGIRSSGPRFEYITRQLGYLLGCDLYDGYLEGRVTPGFVRGLLLTHVEEPGTAREEYFTLVHRLRGLRRRPHRVGTGKSNQSLARSVQP